MPDWKTYKLTKEEEEELNRAKKKKAASADVKKLAAETQEKGRSVQSQLQSGKYRDRKTDRQLTRDLYDYENSLNLLKLYGYDTSEAEKAKNSYWKEKTRQSRTFNSFKDEDSYNDWNWRNNKYKGKSVKEIDSLISAGRGDKKELDWLKRNRDEFLTDDELKAEIKKYEIEASKRGGKTKSFLSYAGNVLKNLGNDTLSGADSVGKAAGEYIKTNDEIDETRARLQRLKEIQAGRKSFDPEKAYKEADSHSLLDVLSPDYTLEDYRNDRDDKRIYGKEAAKRKEEKNLKVLDGSDEMKKDVALYDEIILENQRKASLADSGRSPFAGFLTGKINEEEIAQTSPDIRNIIKKWNKRGYDFKDIYNASKRQSNRELAEYQNEKAEEYAEKHPVLSSLSSVGGSLVGGVAAAPDALYSGLKSAASDGIPEELDVNSPEWALKNATDAIRGKVARKIESDSKNKTLGKAGSFLYQTGLSTADFLAATAAAGFNGSAAELLMGTGAGADAYKSAVENGQDPKNALMRGTLAGAFEGLFEKVSIGNLFKSVESDAGRRLLRNMFTSFVTEGSEEVATDLANLTADALINMNGSEYNERVYNYINDGKDVSRAKALALEEEVENLAGSFLGGALSGAAVAGAGGSMGLVSNNGRYSAIGNDIAESGNERALIELARETAESGAGGEELNDALGYIDRADEKTYNRAYNNEMSGAVRDAVASRLSALSVSPENVNNIAENIIKTAGKGRETLNAGNMGGSERTAAGRVFNEYKNALDNAGSGEYSNKWAENALNAARERARNAVSDNTGYGKKTLGRLYESAGNAIRNSGDVTSEGGSFAKTVKSSAENRLKSVGMDPSTVKRGADILYKASAGKLSQKDAETLGNSPALLRTFNDMAGDSETSYEIMDAPRRERFAGVKADFIAGTRERELFNGITEKTAGGVIARTGGGEKVFVSTGRTENGGEIPENLPVFEPSDGATANLISMAAKSDVFSVQTMNDFITSYRPGQDLNRYTEDFTKVYNAAGNGEGLRTGNIRLSASQARAAYTAGRADAAGDYDFSSVIDDALYNAEKDENRAIRFEEIKGSLNNKTALRAENESESANRTENETSGDVLDAVEEDSEETAELFPDVSAPGGESLTAAPEVYPEESARAYGEEERILTDSVKSRLVSLGMDEEKASAAAPVIEQAYMKDEDGGYIEGLSREENRTALNVLDELSSSETAPEWLEDGLSSLSENNAPENAENIPASGEETPRTYAGTGEGGERLNEGEERPGERGPLYGGDLSPAENRILENIDREVITVPGDAGDLEFSGLKEENGAENGVTDVSSVQNAPETRRLNDVIEEVKKRRTRKGATVLASDEAFKNIDKSKKAQIAVLDEYGKKNNINFVLVDNLKTDDGTDLNGLRVSGTKKIILSLDPEADALLSVAGHEVFHYLSDESPRLTAVLRDYVIDILKKDPEYDYDGRFKEFSERYGTADENAINEEIAANSMFSVIGNEETAADLANNKPSLLKKIGLAIKDFLDRIKLSVKALAAAGWREITALVDRADELKKISSVFQMILDNKNAGVKVTDDMVAETKRFLGMEEGEKQITAEEAVKEAESAENLNSVNKNMPYSIKETGDAERERNARKDRYRDADREQKELFRIIEELNEANGRIEALERDKKDIRDEMKNTRGYAVTRGGSRELARKIIGNSKYPVEKLADKLYDLFLWYDSYDPVPDEEYINRVNHTAEDDKSVPLKTREQKGKIWNEKRYNFLIDTLANIRQEIGEYDGERPPEYYKDNKIALAYETVDAYNGVAKSGGKRIARKTTFADRQKQKRYEELNEERRKLYDKLDAARENYKQELKNAKKDITEKQKERYEKKEKELKTHYEERIRRTRDEGWERLKKVKEEYRTKEAAKRLLQEEKKKRAAVRATLVNKVNDLSKMVHNPTDTNHAPERFRNLITKFTDLFDGQTVSLDPDAILAIKDEYERIFDRDTENGTDEAIGELADFFDPDIPIALDNLRDSISLRYGKGDKSSFYLSDGEQEILSNVAKHFSYIAHHGNSVFLQNKRVNRVALGERGIREVSALKNMKFSKFTLDTMKPYMFFKKMGGVYFDAYSDVLNGQDKAGKNLLKAKEKIDNIKKGLDFGSWGDDLHNKKKAITITTEEGENLTLTVDEALGIYAVAKREQTNKQEARHLSAGGVVLREDLNKLEKARKKAKGEDTGDVTPIRLSAADVRKITKSLTEKQLKFADALIEYMSGDIAKLGNEVSMRLFGYEKFKEGNYYPFHTDENFISGNVEQTKQKNANTKTFQKNKSFTKATVKGASTPVVAENFTEVVADHIADMINYNALAVPQTTLNSLFNYKPASSPEGVSLSMKARLENALGRSGRSYVYGFIEAISGGVRADPQEGLFNKMIGKFKKSAVASNLSVIVQQPMSVGRALSMIDPKYFGTTAKKYGYRELKKYSGTAVIKEMGRFDVDTGETSGSWLMAENYDLKSLRELKRAAKAFFDLHDSSFRDDLFGRAAGKADEITWNFIWQAVKKETADKTGFSGEELLKASGKRFNEVIEATQVYDSHLSRSPIMRSNSALVKTATAFMAEPITRLNMFRDAIWRFKTNKTGENAKFMMRTMGSLLISSFMTVLVKSAVGAGRDDDPQQSFTEKYIESVINNSLTEFNMLECLPYVKDIISIMQGYSVERADMSLFEDLIGSIEELTSLFNDSFYALTREEQERKIAEAVGNVFGVLGSFAGLPVKNIARDINALVRIGRAAGDDKKPTREGVKYSAADGITEAINYRFLKKPLKDIYPNENDIYRAIRKGDGEKALNGWDEFQAYLVYMGKEPDEAFKQVKSKVKSKIKTGVLKGELTDKDAEEYLLTYIEDDNAYWTVKEWRFDADPANDGKSFSKYDRLKDLVLKGADIKEAVRELTDHNTKENAVKDRVTQIVEDAFNDGTISKKKADELLKKYEGFAANQTVFSKVLENDTDVKRLTDKWQGNKNAPEGEYYTSWDDLDEAVIKNGDTGSAVSKLTNELDYSPDEIREHIGETLKSAYESGELSRSDVITRLVRYADKTTEQAANKVDVWQFKIDNPEADITNENTILDYLEVEDSGITLDVFTDYYERKSKCKGRQDENGKTVSGSKKAEIMAVIDSLPITTRQKDALYRINGWSENTIGEAPWR